MWNVECLEFPVEVRGRDTKLDMVLEYTRTTTVGPGRLLAVAECKRANPAFVDWCFARGIAGAVRDLVVDRLRYQAIHEASGAKAGYAVLFTDEVWDVAYPLKSKEKGDGGGEGRDVINSAVTQVLRGVNGLLEHLAKNETTGLEHARPSVVYVVPVIFTTARLWTSDQQLNEASLADGNMPLLSNLRETPWVWLQETVSHGIRHSLQLDPLQRPVPDGLHGQLAHRFTRHVAVVNAMHARAFLADSNWIHAPRI